MNIESPQEMGMFKQLMSKISKYYGKDIDTDTLQIMLSSLQKFNFEDIKNACNVHVTSPDHGQFMIKASDIVRTIEGDLGTKAAKAWTTADKALRTKGPYTDIRFQDPIIMLVIRDMGGWIKFCTGAKDDNYPFIQKDFERRYRDYAMHPLQMDTPDKLTGIAHQSNSQSHKQNDRIEGKTTKKMGYDEVMAKIRSFGLNVEPEPEPEQQQQQQVASHEAQ